MSQSKSKRVLGAKIVGSRNEINLRLYSSSSRKQDIHSESSAGIANQARAASCKNNSFAYVCSGCGKPIKRDKFLLKACDKYWHENCLKCDRCHSRLGELGSTLYCKSDMNLCRQDYLEMFGKTGVCSVCEKLICASEMVMRAKQNVYHLECFACQLCNQRFCVGDRFYLCENKVVCQYDYEEHILPIQQSMVGQTTDTAIYLAHQEATGTIQLQTIKFNVCNDELISRPRQAEQPGPEANLSNFEPHNPANTEMRISEKFAAGEQHESLVSAENKKEEDVKKECEVSSENAA